MVCPEWRRDSEHALEALNMGSIKRVGVTSHVHVQSKFEQVIIKSLHCSVLLSAKVRSIGEQSIPSHQGDEGYSGNVCKSLFVEGIFVCVEFPSVTL